MKVRVHNDIPWNKIKKFWDAGKSYEFIAKAIDRFDPKSADPTKPCRAIVSRGLNQGWKDKDGSIQKLEPREGMRAIGIGKKVNKGKVKAQKTTAATAKPHKVAGQRGPRMKPAKVVLIQSTDDHKFVRIEAEQKKMLVSAPKYVQGTIKVLDVLGYSVVAKSAADKTVPADQVVTTEVVEQINKASEEVATEPNTEAPTTEAPTTEAPTVPPPEAPAEQAAA